MALAQNLQQASWANINKQCPDPMKSAMADLDCDFYSKCLEGKVQCG